MVRLPQFLLVLTILLATPILPAVAQEYRPPTPQGTNMPFFRYVNPGEPSVMIMVVGSGAGMYEVGIDTDLAELLILTGGASSVTSSAQTRTDVSVRLYRGSEARRDVVYEASMEELLTEPAASPSLQEGDVFMVRSITRNRFTWRDVATTVSILASLTIIAGRVFNQF